MDQLLTATEMAEAFGVTARTLHFYEAKGLLSPRRVGSTRAYANQDRGQLKLILRGKRLGFSLAQIKEYLELYDADPEQVEQIQKLVGLVRARIAALTQQQNDLADALTELQDIDRQAMAALKQKGLEPDAA